MMYKGFKASDVYRRATGISVVVIRKLTSYTHVQVVERTSVTGTSGCEKAVDGTSNSWNILTVT